MAKTVFSILAAFGINTHFAKTVLSATCLITVGAGFAACASSTPDPSVPSLRASSDIPPLRADADRAVYGIDQIAPARTEPDIAQRQIPQSAIVEQLSVDQLKTYADRCLPGQPSPAGLDCSNLALRVQRLFRSDDEVARALSVLDRLVTQGEVEDSSTGLFVQRAIASGALLTAPLAPEPVPDLTPEEELPVDSLPIGAIISSSGG